MKVCRSKNREKVFLVKGTKKNMKNFIIAIIFSSSLFISCDNSKKKVGFFLNDTFFLEAASIEDLEKLYPITFAQYEGFCFHSTDSIFRTVFLNIPEQRTIESDIVDRITINKLKKSKINKIIIKYTLGPNDSIEGAKRIIKNRFQGLIIKEELNSNDFLIMYDKKQVVCRVMYFNSFIRNYRLEYYPIKQ